jgi:hypothetical protein|tara:strand:- start:1069 stop:1317 length:249 start_codon:yes stop_codon:yes gene_type:complete
MSKSLRWEPLKVVAKCNATFVCSAVSSRTLPEVGFSVPTAAGIVRTPLGMGRILRNIAGNRLTVLKDICFKKFKPTEVAGGS